MPLLSCTTDSRFDGKGKNESGPARLCSTSKLDVRLCAFKSFSGEEEGGGGEVNPFVFVCGIGDLEYEAGESMGEEEAAEGE